MPILSLNSSGFRYLFDVYLCSFYLTAFAAASAIYKYVHTLVKQYQYLHLNPPKVISELFKLKCIKLLKEDFMRIVLSLE